MISTAIGHLDLVNRRNMGALDSLLVRKPCPVALEKILQVSQTAAQPLVWSGARAVRQEERRGEREGGRGRGQGSKEGKGAACVASDGGGRGRGRLPSSCAAAFIDSRSEWQSERGKERRFNWRKRGRGIGEDHHGNEPTDPAAARGHGILKYERTIAT